MEKLTDCHSVKPWSSELTFNQAYLQSFSQKNIENIQILTDFWLISMMENGLDLPLPVSNQVLLTNIFLKLLISFFYGKIVGYKQTYLNIKHPKFHLSYKKQLTAT